MNRLSSLKSLLVDSLFELVVPKSGWTFARLTEKDHPGGAYEIRVNGVAENSILLKMDKVPQPKCIFKGSKGERRRCDYLLFTVFNGNPIILFMELKSKRGNIAESSRQFKGALCFIDYCDSALRHFHGQLNLLGGLGKFFVVFYHMPLNKKPTNHFVSPRKPNTEPDTAFLCAYPPNHIDIGSLVRP